MIKWLGIVSLSLVCVVSTVALSQSTGQWKSSEHMWESLCQYCHESAIGPPILGRHLPPELTMITVRQGRNAMPSFLPFQISDTELRQLANWVNEHKGQPAPASSQTPPDSKR